MVLVVESGEGDLYADAYVSIAFTDTYHSDRGNLDWASVITSVKEEAIRNATEYLDATYGWIGYIKLQTQALGWPRTFAYDKEGRDLSDIVPLGVERACSELALTALSSNLLDNTTRSDFVTREKVDVIEVEYKDGSPKGVQYNYVDRLLGGLTSGSADSSQVSLVRV